MKTKMVLILLNITLFTYAGEFTIIRTTNKVKEQKTAKCFWTNKVVRDDAFNGIAIRAEFENPGWDSDGLIFFIRSFRDIGKYRMEGTKTSEWGKADNIIYCFPSCYWVSTDDNSEAYITITKKTEKFVSGSYHAKVYYYGKLNEKEMAEIQGTFTDVEYRQN